MSDKSSAPSSLELPDAIQRKLDALASRIRRVVLTRGVLATLAAALIALAILMGIDTWFTILSTSLRFALSIAALVFVLAIFWFKLIQPARQKYTPSEIARIIESRHPELQERISTAVELLSKNTPEAMRGSSQLLDEVVKAASTDASLVRPRREFSSRKLRRYALITLAVGGLLGAAFAAWPKPTARLIKRAVMPSSPEGNFYADRISVDPGSLNLAEGDALTILVDAPAGTERAELRTQFGETDSETIERMSVVAITDGTNKDISRFSVTFPTVSKSFRYRVRSGKAVSAFYDVGVIPRPLVENIAITYRFPEYTGRPEQTIASSDGTISAVSGSTALVTAQVDRTMKSAAMHINEAPVWVNSQSAENGKPLITWTVDLQTDMSGVWKIVLEDFSGIRNLPVEFPITIHEDVAPGVKIVSPESNQIELKPTDTLNIGYLATDDFGLTIATLLITTSAMAEGESLPVPQELPVPSEDGSYIGEAKLPIPGLAINGARDFQVRVAVTDGMGQEAVSDPLFIRVRNDAQSLLEQSVARQAEEFSKRLWDILQNLTAAKELSAEMPAAFVLLGDQAIPQETIDALSQTQSLISEAESGAAEVGQMMAGTIFTRQSEDLEEILTDYIVPARQSAEVIPLSDDKIARVHKSRLLVRHLEDAITAIQNSLRSLQNNAANAKTLSKVSEITDRQRELAELIADPRNEAILQDLQEAQLDLSKLMEQAIRQNAQSFEERFQMTRSDADKLADLAKSLAGDQQALAEMLEKAIDPESREDATLDMLQWLEAEQREIGTESVALTKFAKAGEEALRLALQKSSQSSKNAADRLRENTLEDAAQAALANVITLEEAQSGDPAVTLELHHLLQWQEAIASQIQGLASNDLDSALAAMQQKLAENSAALEILTEQLQQSAAQLAASQAMQQAMKAAGQIANASAAAAAAGAQLGGQALNQFRFDNAPGQMPDGTNIPANLPPAATQAGQGGEPLDRTLFGNNPSRPDSDLPPDLAMLEGSRENPFSIGESFLDTFPPALKDEEMSITGGENPPDFAPPGANVPGNGGGVNVAEGTGQGSSLGAAMGSAQGAAAGLASAANSLASAAESLNSETMQAPDTQPMEMPEIAEAMEKAMEADSPIEAAEAAKEAALAMQSMMTQMSAERADAMKNWQRVRGQVQSGVATEAQGATPDEYRDLVKKYFQEIARRETTNAPQ